MHQVRHKRSSQAAPPRVPQPHARHAGPHPTSRTNVLLFRKHSPTGNASPPARLVAAAWLGSALTESGSTASRSDADGAPPAAPPDPTPTAPMGATGGNSRGRHGGARDPQRQARCNQDCWPQAVNDGTSHGRPRHPSYAPACRAASRRKHAVLCHAFRPPRENDDTLLVAPPQLPHPPIRSSFSAQAPASPSPAHAAPPALHVPPRAPQRGGVGGPGSECSSCVSLHPGPGRYGTAAPVRPLPGNNCRQPCR